MQLSPAQQSALIVQAPHAGTQACPLHTNCGPPEPAPGLGTQGARLQQSALDRHCRPAPTQLDPVQRGTPTLSGLHVSLWQLPEQQSHDALQLMLASRQTSPLGLHERGLRQLPRTFGGEMLHAPGAL